MNIISPIRVIFGQHSKNALCTLFRGEVNATQTLTTWLGQHIKYSFRKSLKLFCGKNKKTHKHNYRLVISYQPLCANQQQSHRYLHTQHHTIATVCRQL